MADDDVKRGTFPCNAISPLLGRACVRLGEHDWHSTLDKNFWGEMWKDPVTVSVDDFISPLVKSFNELDWIIDEANKKEEK